ncbi:MAG: TrkA family potassium uptake protein [Armatimonadetes bacterium]|nr:TrkA family potassium uptake protein [Armatimonadota bacterium]
MTVVVIGCGRVGAELAYRLFEKGHRVTVVDADLASFAGVRSGFRGRTVVGDCLDREVLERAGLEDSDAVAVVTSSDAVNAVAAHIAQTVFNVPIVVARSYEPSRRKIFDEFGVNVVSTANWLSDQVEDLLGHGGLRSLLRTGRGEACVYELTVSAAWDGRKLGDLLPADVRPVALTRHTQGLLADRDTTIETGDTVLVAANADGLAQLEALLGNAREA